MFYNNAMHAYFDSRASEEGNVFVLFLLWTPIVFVLNPADVEVSTVLHAEIQTLLLHGQIIHKTKSHSKSKMITGPANSMFGERYVLEE